MERFLNGATATTLNGAITNSQTTITVTSAAVFGSSVNFRIRIRNEIMLVTGIAGNVLTVARAQEGTTANSQPNAANVNYYLTAGAIAQYRKENFGRGTYASRPNPAAKGMIYQCTDAPYLLYYNGSTWDMYGPCWDINVPFEADYTWLNQGTSVYTEQTFVPQISSTFQLRGLYRTLPAPPYTMTCIMSWQESRDITGQFWGGGLFLRESSSGKLISFHYINRDTGGCEMETVKWTNETTFSASYWSFVSQLQVIAEHPCKMLWWQILDDGTNRHYKYSADGFNYHTLHFTTRTDFLTPNQGGFCTIHGHATKAPETTILHFNVN